MRIRDIRALALTLVVTGPAIGAADAQAGGTQRAAQERIFTERSIAPGATVVVAQGGGQPAGAEANSEETRRRLQEILRQYPPALRSILRLDPSLATAQTYLAPYPALAAFLAQHPEIARTPTYYFGEESFNNYWSPEQQRARTAENMMAATLVTVGVPTALAVFLWLVKSALDHRRWVRQSKIQTDAHSKLLDRLTSNEDLLAYIQTPVGRRFLESAPVAMTGPISGASPVSRILWSVQAGAVASAVGIGFLFASSRFAADTESPLNPTAAVPMVNAFADVAPALFIIGSIVLAAGIGFVLSAGAAYVLARRLGVLVPTESVNA